MEIEHHSKLSGTIEVVETYIGGVKRGMGRRYVGNKTAVMAMIERGGDVRSQVVENVTSAMLGKLLKQHVAKSAHLNTDESPLYRESGERFPSDGTVNHGHEYVRRDKKSGRLATTNTVERFFGDSKRSLDGTLNHISRKYLPFYLTGLDFKCSTRNMTDGVRTAAAVPKIVGKRLMLHRPGSRAD